MKYPRLIALEFSLCMRPIRSVWLSKAVLWSIKERPLCWAWEWHFIDIKNSLMAKWFGFDPAVKRLERPEAKHNVIQIKERKTQVISHPDNAVLEALNHKGGKLHGDFILFFTFVHFSPKHFVAVFFPLHDLQFILFFSIFFFFKCINPNYASKNTFLKNGKKSEKIQQKKNTTPRGGQ